MEIKTIYNQNASFTTRTYYLQPGTGQSVQLASSAVLGPLVGTFCSRHEYLTLEGCCDFLGKGCNTLNNCKLKATNIALIGFNIKVKQVSSVQDRPET